ncbi:MAG: alkaline phosphatase family protein [Bacteroidia bacterium]
MAKRLFIPFLKFYVFWMIVFTISRTVFLFWNMEEWRDAPIAETLGVFIHSLYLDTAMACYLLVIPWLLLTLSIWTEKITFFKALRIYHLLLIIIIGFITFGELPIYDEWHHKLTYKAVWFLGNPMEVVETASWKQLLFGIGAVVLFSWMMMKIYSRLSPAPSSASRKPYTEPLLFTLVVPVLMGIGIRGGLQPIPIQVSDAYYSQYNILNTTSVNSVFHLFTSIIESKKSDQAYTFISGQESVQITSALFKPEKDTMLQVLTTTRPNVVLFVLESWSADLIEKCGGDSDVTPHFNQLTNDGILFTNCYASGSLSDQGMAAVFSGFPAQPKTSIITQPNKYVHLPCINKNFKGAGYKTSFMFGGQLSYGNIRAYMYYNEFDKIIEGKDFDASIPQGRLGVHDEFLFERQLKELQSEKQPFFAAMFTLSTHGPFDFPMKHVLNRGGKEKDYINSVYYADRSIHQFLEKAKKETWYKNTLFVFVSDHSHNSPKNWAFNQPEYRKIPLFFYGEVIKPEYRGKLISDVCSQTDLAATLLGQLNMNTSEYLFSKNLFNPYHQKWAYYSFDEGFGWLHDNAFLVWHVKQDAVEFKKTDSLHSEAALKKEGQAMLKRVTDEYLRY